MKKKLVGLFIASVLLTGCGNDFGPMPEEDFLIIAHRGASAYEPENTLASFELAQEMKADYIELDVHLTKDDQLIIMHDDDVKNTTDADGKIEDLTLDELKQISADFRFEEGDRKPQEDTGKEYEIPTLTEVLDKFEDKMQFIIELKDPEKYPGIEKMLVDLLEERELIGTLENGYPQVVIHSFEKDALKKVHELNEEIPLLQLISFDDDEEAKVKAKKLKDLKSYAAGVGVSYEAITKGFVKKMHKEGLAVYAYTVNEAEVANDLKGMGVNGIHTDRPDILEE